MPIIAAIVFIISVVAFGMARRHRQQNELVDVHEMTTEILIKLDELEVLQHNLIPLLCSEKVMKIIADRLGVDIENMRNTSKKLIEQIAECQELREYLNNTREDLMDPRGLRDSLFRIDEAIRDLRKRLDNLPPEMREILRGDFD